MDAIGPLFFCCHLVSHYFINVLITTVLLRSVNQICEAHTHKQQLGRNATAGSSVNDHNGLFSFKCTVSATTDRVVDRQTA